MEKDLAKYVRQNRFNFAQTKFKEKLVFDAQMQVAPLSEAASNAYLGDLLAHTRRFDEAEPFLLTALSLEPDLNMAVTALGMVKLRQRKFDEARSHLEKAVASDGRNHIALYRYAYLLSREGRDEFGRVMGFNEATTAKMRDALKKAIAANPSFTESYELLAFVNLVKGDQLDESLTLLKTALRYQPGNQRYALRIAEILVRQDKFNDAAAIADKIAATADDGEIRGRAQSLVSDINNRKQFAERHAASGMQLGGPPRMIGQSSAPPTEAELAKREAETNLLTMNEALRPVGDGDLRVIGNIQKIDCRTRPIVYTIRSGGETLTLTSADFQGLSLNTFDPKASSLEVGCDEDLSAQLSVLTFRAATGAKTGPKGELISIEFVPASFRLLTEEERAAARASIHMGSGDDTVDINDMMAALRSSLPKPGSGEKRQMGFLEKIECTSKGSFFHLRTAGGTLRLVSPPPGSLSITIYARDLDGIQFGCELKPVDFPAVFIYRDNPDAKAKTDGELTSLSVMPRSFTLE
jgi:tetratricopeptide (TPR) repeat protein